ncbi:MAG: PfkB family carbohydrate kinase, partial [Desulfarculaceae bacterium]
VVCQDRPTTVKTRVVAHSQQVVRVDREDRKPMTEEEASRICSFLEKELSLCDAVIVSDYHKGVINQMVSDCLKEAAARHQRMWVVDPKVPNMPLYTGATIVTPNHLEAAAAAGVLVDRPDYVTQAGRKLREKFGFEHVLVTQGAGGMTLFTTDAETHIPTAAKQVFDVTGAGDTVISTLTLALVSGLEPTEAALLANLAAGVVVAEVGTSAITSGRLSQALNQGMQELIKRN